MLSVIKHLPYYYRRGLVPDISNIPIGNIECREHINYIHCKVHPHVFYTVIVKHVINGVKENFQVV